MYDRAKFNVFVFISTFATALIEVFIALFLFKNGFSLSSILWFYLLENAFALFISYGLVRIGEKYEYSMVMCIGIAAFIAFQFALNNIVDNGAFLVLISLLYSLYRRGYWVARRYYVTDVMPQRNSSEPFSVVVIVSEIASITAGFLGGLLLDGFNVLMLTLLSSVLLFISVIPLLKIRKRTGNTKIELLKNLKKYDRRNYLAFSLYEINNLVAFLFPIFITIYIKDTYLMAGAVNAIGNLAIILFVLFYGRIIRKRNYFVMSSILFVIVRFAKLLSSSYSILVLCFLEGFMRKMQEQSVNKIYFENRNKMDLAHYNLIYQMIEALARMAVVIPLFFMGDIRIMIAFALVVISVEVVIYACFKKNKEMN